VYGAVSYSKGDDNLNKDSYKLAGADTVGIEAANRTVLQVGLRHKF